MSAPKAVLNPTTGQFDLVEMTPEEIVEQVKRATNSDPLLELLAEKEKRRQALLDAVANLPGEFELQKMDERWLITKQQAVIKALLDYMGF